MRLITAFAFSAQNWKTTGDTAITTASENTPRNRRKISVHQRLLAVNSHANIRHYPARLGTVHGPHQDQDTTKALNKMLASAEKALPIGNNEYYLRGVVYVVVNGEVKTAYKPHQPSTQARIFRAFNPPPKSL
jgi:nucleoside-diphosphate-sugar epimerase